MLQPRAFGSLNHVDPSDSVSNYYLTYLVANYYGMPNYYIQGGVGIQAGNMEDIGMMVEMESLYLQYVAYNANMWERPGGEANFQLYTVSDLINAPLKNNYRSWVAHN